MAEIVGFTSLSIQNEGHSIKILRGSNIIPEFHHLHDVIGHKGETIDFTTSVDPLDDLTAMRKGENYPYDKMFRVYIFMRGRNLGRRINKPLYFDIQDVVDQAGWTHDAAGLAQALEDINGWYGGFTPSDLNLDLIIRTPQFVLDATTRANNGFIEFDDPPDTGNPDVSKLLDQTINGYDLVAASIAKMSHWDNVNFSVDHDGVDDTYPLPAQFITDHGADNEGEWIMVFDEDEGTGVNIDVFTMADVTPTNNLRLQIRSNDIIRLATNLEINTIFTEVTNRSGRNTIFWSADGSDNEINTNGVDDAVFSGGDGGFWLNDIASIVNILTFSYSAAFCIGGLRFLGYRDSRLTSDERTQLKTWLDANV